MQLNVDNGADRDTAKAKRLPPTVPTTDQRKRPKCVESLIGSLRVSAQYFITSTEEQASLVALTVANIFTEYGRDVGFVVTVLFLGRAVTVSKLKGPGRISMKMVCRQLPQITSACFTADGAHLVVTGHCLTGARIWASCDGNSHAEYMTCVESSQPADTKH